MREQAMPSCAQLHVRVFADGAELSGILQMAANPLIKGFTTNPTLMRKAGIVDYRGFAREVLQAVPDRPISFEVFSDEFDEMEAQALEIASWGANVNVKIPVTNTRREFAGPLLGRLSRAGVALNVTAVMTNRQVQQIVEALDGAAPAFVSVFAGRVADTGRDPIPLMTEAVAQVNARPGTELIWASPRELLNIFQADEIGCHIITVTNDILKKLDGVGKDLAQFSLETVEMFRNDAVKAGYRIECPPVAGSSVSLS
jgi:transaldolase